MPSDASARQCRDEIASLRGSHEQAFLETVSVMPIEQWFAELWDSTFPDQQVLRPVQLLSLARSIIESSDHYPDNCLNSLAICRRFIEAYMQHLDYQLAEDREAYLFSPEYEGFAAWQVEMDSVLDSMDSLTTSHLPIKLLELLFDDALSLPDQVFISEQALLTPSSKLFIEALSETCSVQQLQTSNYESIPDLVVAPQLNDECEQVASWIKENISDLNDFCSIGVLVPDLNAYKAPLQSALSRILYPQSLFPSEGAQICEPWVFEGGDKLLSYPLIMSAWDIISLQGSRLPTEHLSRILRSPNVAGWPEHRSTRAAIDVVWRERLSPLSKLPSALKLASFTSGFTPASIQFLVDIKEDLVTAPREQLPSQWVRFFDQLLLKAGWPNTESTDPVVIQCRRGLSQAMDVFRALDRQLGIVSHSDALSWLHHILSTKKFSLSREWHTPVRIMNYDEAISLKFDAVWIMGLDDASLPRRAEPSPFLPLTLQQASGIPDSDPEQVLIRDAALLKSLLGSAPSVVISHCKENASGARLHLSSLVELHNEIQPYTASNSYQLTCELTTPDTDLVSPINLGDLAELRGGTGLFKEYASSPFLAFLKYRLNLAQFPEPEEGLNHRMQGILVHDALQHFWVAVRNKSTLESMSEDGVNTLVGECVDKAMDHPELYPARYGASLLALERLRLVTLISCWINDKERSRLEDFEVISVEKSLNTNFMGIPLKLRVDRIDSVNGHKLYIDYKTGGIDGQSMNASSLTEPQLPIYALTDLQAGEAVDGVMLASVKSPEDFAIHMRSNWANSVVKKAASKQYDVASDEAWNSQLAAWEGALKEMATGILAGNIAHDYNKDHERGFSAHLLPLLRGESNAFDEGDA